MEADTINQLEQSAYLMENVFSEMKTAEVEEIRQSLLAKSMLSLDAEQAKLIRIDEILNNMDIQDYCSIILAELARFKRIDLVIKYSGYMSKAQEEMKKQARSSFTQRARAKEEFKYLNLKTNPFEFQYALAQNGLNRENSIVCLRTGAGKTLISSIICKHWYLQYKKENRLDEFKVAFIVPTRHLAEQQCNAFKVAFHEDPDNMLVEIREKMTVEKVAESFKNHNILFLTAKKLVNTVEKNLIDIFDFTILVFDECHHASELHPFSEIMNLYYKEKSASHSRPPLIVGLTASLGVGKGSVVENLIKFCSHLDCQQILHLTDEVHLKELKENVPSPNEDTIIRVPYNKDQSKVVSVIKDCIKRIEGEVKLVRDPNLDFKIGYQEYESFIVEKRKQAELDLDREVAIACKYLFELHNMYNRIDDFTISMSVEAGKTFLEKQINEIKMPEKIEKYCQNSFDDVLHTIGQMAGSISGNQKLHSLSATILSNHKQDSRGLVLVKTRYHTKALEAFIKNDDLLKGTIKVDRLTGQGPSEEFSMTDTQQREVLERFRKGSVNLLIATDIAQEGLDVAECNYVIRYEFVANEIGTVQSRGRARANGSQCYLVTYDGSVNERRELENRKKEQEMYRALVTWKEIPELTFKKLFKEYQSRLTDAHDKRDNEATSQCKTRSNANIKILCRECSGMICKATDLRYREPNYLCVAADFEKKAQVSYQTQRIFCGKTSCNKEIGKILNFAKGKTRVAFIMDIKGIKFQFNNDVVEIYKQWSKIPFYVPEYDS